MPKDIEWVREQIKEERNLLNSTRYEKEVDDLTTGVLLGLKKALNILDQFDEPELTDEMRETIESALQAQKDASTVEKVTDWTLDDIINMAMRGELEHTRGKIVVDKPVIPKFVADYLELAKSDIPLMRVLELANTRNELPKWEKEYDWISANDEKFARAWLDGYTVKEEQKYYVDLETAAYVAKWNGDGRVDIYTDGISGSDEYELHLTEQEIKDYDERFWPFAVPVKKWDE